MEMTTTHINKNDKLQTITIPEEMKIDDDKVYLKKVGNAILIIPFHNPWYNMIESIDNFSDDYLSEERSQLSNTNRTELN
jgi:antitoxin VapB